MKEQNRGHMPGYSGDYTYIHVIKAANKAGIRVRALDCTASYHVKGLRTENGRYALFSYFANEVIKADQAALGPHRWVALMGNGHVDMALGVPGIAQLQDAVSLAVKDVAPSQARTLHRGGWEIVDGGMQGPGHVAVRSDFRIDVGVDNARPWRARGQTDRAWLRSVNDFLIERPSSTQANVLHRADNGEIISTPIRIDDKGQFYVERWPQLKDQRFIRLEQVSEVLKAEVRLKAVSAETVPEARLKKTGNFLIERPSATQTNLVHRSNTDEVITTPIKTDAGGQFYIERWPEMIGQRYLTVDDLIEALKTRKNLSQVR